MEENKPTSTASAPSGSTSTADQENRTQIRTMLLGHLRSFAKEQGCPNPWSWAQAWASTVIGPSWKNWDMPSGNPLQTGLNKLVENTGSRPILAEQRMQQASSAPPAPTGEKTEEKGSYRSESSSNIRSRILESFYKMTEEDQTYVLTRITSMSNVFGRYDEVTKKAAASNLRYAFPQYFAAPAETSAPASGEISPIVSFRTLSDRCLQVQAFYRSGDITEPEWHAHAGLAARCSDGEVEFHACSKNDFPAYNYAEAQRKLDTAGASTTGATTCKRFDDVNPGVCGGCPEWGRILSPISLGV